LAEVCQRLGERQRALQLLAKLPESLKVFELRARLLLEEDSPAPAVIAAMLQKDALRYEYPPALFRLASLAWQRAAAREKDPEQSRNAWREAKELYERYLSQEPHSLDAVLGYAQILEKLGEEGAQKAKEALWSVRDAGRQEAAWHQAWLKVLLGLKDFEELKQ